jgi:hypothetical protein
LVLSGLPTTAPRLKTITPMLLCSASAPSRCASRPRRRRLPSGYGSSVTDEASRHVSRLPREYGVDISVTHGPKPSNPRWHCKSAHATILSRSRPRHGAITLLSVVRDFETGGGLEWRCARGGARRPGGGCSSRPKSAPISTPLRRRFFLHRDSMVFDSAGLRQIRALDSNRASRRAAATAPMRRSEVADNEQNAAGNFSSRRALMSNYGIWKPDHAKDWRLHCDWCTCHYHCLSIARFGLWFVLWTLPYRFRAPAPAGASSPLRSP